MHPCVHPRAGEFLYVEDKGSELPHAHMGNIEEIARVRTWAWARAHGHGHAQCALHTWACACAHMAVKKEVVRGRERPSDRTARASTAGPLRRAAIGPGAAAWVLLLLPGLWPACSCARGPARAGAVQRHALPARAAGAHPAQAHVDPAADRCVQGAHVGAHVVRMMCSRCARLGAHGRTAGRTAPPAAHPAAHPPRALHTTSARPAGCTLHAPCAAAAVPRACGPCHVPMR